MCLKNDNTRKDIMTIAFDKYARARRERKDRAGEAILHTPTGKAISWVSEPSRTK